MNTESLPIWQLFRDQLEGMMDDRWTKADIDDIISEAIRLIKKDDSFWECLDYALEEAVENVFPETDEDDEWGE